MYAFALFTHGGALFGIESDGKKGTDHKIRPQRIKGIIKFTPFAGANCVNQFCQCFARLGGGHFAGFNIARPQPPHLTRSLAFVKRCNLTAGQIGLGSEGENASFRDFKLGGVDQRTCRLKPMSRPDHIRRGDFVVLERVIDTIHNSPMRLAFGGQATGKPS